jgi:DNA-directed RNA polymerase subunit omega
MSPNMIIDCERVVPNRFELVLLAAARARALNRGETPLVSPDADKSTVIALHEIGTGAIDRARLRQRLPTPGREGQPNVVRAALDFVLQGMVGAMLAEPTGGSASRALG